MRLSWPLPPECKRISQRFGENPSFYREYGLAGHEGLDVACPVNTHVLAAHDGWTNPQWGPIYGNQVWLRGEGFLTLYAHLNSTSVRRGQEVTAGEGIGLSGSTGRSSGPHLHLGLQIDGVSNPDFKGWLDPLPYLRRNMSKLNPHFQKIPDWAKPLWANCSNEWYKMVIPPIGDPFPDKKGIGRPWIGGDHVENTYIREGAAGAERYFGLLKSYYLDRPYVWAWEGPNEPHPMNDAGFRAALDDFTARWVDLMHGIGKRTVALCLSVGWPDQPEHILGFASALESTDFWALHEYSAPTMQDAAGWHCLRYRQTVQALRDAGHRIPPLLITECGIDGGVLSPPQGKTGWKTHARDEEDFMGQLAWYDRELCQDDYVKAAFIFTSGPESEWVDFDVGEGLTRKLVGHINSSSPLPVEPLPPSVPDEPTLDDVRWARGALGIWPATLKDARLHGEEWIVQDPNQESRYISRNPTTDVFFVVVLDSRTWKRIRVTPLGQTSDFL